MQRVSMSLERKDAPVTDLLERLEASVETLDTMSEPFLADIARDARSEILRLRRTLQKVSRFPLHHPGADEQVREIAAIAMECLAGERK